MPRKSWDEYFIDLALAASTRSTCLKRHVGCVIVDRNKHVISTGYNGSKPGEPHCEDVGCLIIDGKCKRTIHAEINAIKQASWWRRQDSKLYCTDFPCMNCAKAIARSGVSKVVYAIPPRKPKKDVLDLFFKKSIVVKQVNPG